MLLYQLIPEQLYLRRKIASPLKLMKSKRLLKKKKIKEKADSKDSQLREIGAGVSTLIPCGRGCRAEGAQEGWTAPVCTGRGKSTQYLDTCWFLLIALGLTKYPLYNSLGKNI